VLIKSIQIIDGTGKAPYRADVLLKGEKISAIGNFPNKTAENTIDGLGLYLAPGFIDIQSSVDHYLSLFSNPTLEDFLLQGVTTTIGGHCGSSLAPLIYGTLESIQKWADPNQINVDWHSIREFLGIMNRRKIGINFGTLVGHSTIRRALIGEEVRDLTKSELNIFGHLLRESLHEGALGFSTGLGYVHSRKTPFEEIATLVDMVAKEGGLYATHLRNERAELAAAVEETIAVAEKTSARTLISHFRPIFGYEKEFEKALAIVENRSEALDLHFTSYPFDTSIVPIYTLLPEWAQAGGFRMILDNLEKTETIQRLQKDFTTVDGRGIHIAQLGRAASLNYLVGKSLAEFAENQELTVPMALIKLMQLTRLRAIVFVKNVNLDLTVKSFSGRAALITANSAGLATGPQVLKHERFTNTFPRYLELVSINNLLSLEEAIQRVTAMPAEKLGLKKRGVIQEGAFADLVLFSRSPQNIFAVEHVFVNGIQAVRSKKFQSVLAGKILKRS
jgi:N-acyl-D-amino-acid deacylase